VVLLQDADHFRDFWQPRFAEHGYDCLFKQRTETKARHTEGVVVAYNRDVLQLFKSIPVELNDSCKVRNDISRELFDNVQNDDVALIAFLQPWKKDFLTSAICVVSAMTSEKEGQVHTLVRALEIEMLTKSIEKANQEFQVPTFIGVSLYDSPASPAYHILRTGRQPIRPEMPRKPAPPRVEPLCRGTVRLSWLPPLVSIADPPVLSYKICWRPGGSTTLSFRTEKVLEISQCMQYVKRKDAMGVMRTVALEELAFNLVGLTSEMPYEFKVCAVNKVGQGVWSDATPVVVLTAATPSKVPAMPPPKWLKSIEQVHQIREGQTMGESDWDAAKSSSQHAYSETHLTPRLMSGGVDVQVGRGRVLPLSTNARTGWDDRVHGQGSADLVSFMHVDKRLRKSALRDMEGKFTVEVSDSSSGRKSYHVQSSQEVQLYDDMVQSRRMAEISQREAARAESRRKLQDAQSEKGKDNHGSRASSAGGPGGGVIDGAPPPVGGDEAAVPDGEAACASGSFGGEDNEAAAQIMTDGSSNVENETARNTEANRSAPVAGHAETSTMSAGYGGDGDPAYPSSPSLTRTQEQEQGHGQSLTSISFADGTAPVPPLEIGALGASLGSMSLIGPGGLLDNSVLKTMGDDGDEDDEWTNNPSDPVIGDGSESRMFESMASMRTQQTIVHDFLPGSDAHLGHPPGSEPGAESLETDDDILLDGDAITRRLGRPDVRQVHSLNLRSAYERYSVAGEPAFTFAQPAEGDHCPPPRGVRCLDYLFYSFELLVPKRVGVLPPLASSLDTGDDPREQLQSVDPVWEQPPRRLEHLFAESRLGLKHATDDPDAMAPKIGGGGGHGGFTTKHHIVSASEISRMKNTLSRYFADPNRTQDVWVGSWLAPSAQNVFRKSTALPNSIYCSPHFALVSEFDISHSGSLAVEWR